MISRKLIKAVSVLMLYVNITQAQPFFTVDGGIKPNAVLSLYADTANNILYAGGAFSLAGNIKAHCIATWDGNNWDSTRNQILYPPGDQIRGIEKFNNEIYVSGLFGFFDTSGNLAGSSIAKWDSLADAWVNFGANPYGTVHGLYSYNNYLYLLGDFDSIGGIYSSKIASYDGTNWYAFPLVNASGGWGVIADAIFYNGNLYAGGNFGGGGAAPINDLAMFDGIQWLPVGSGLSGGFTWVNDFTIYQGKLIVAGLFSTASGDPGNSIAAWDGITWSQLGAGVTTGQVLDVEVYNGELWALGCFNTLPCSYLAKWNGIQWDTLGIILDNAPHAMTVLGNDLYIAGNFWTMNGDTVNRIIRYNYLTGFEELGAKNNELEIFPNPTSGTLNIKNFNSLKLKNIFVYNTLGEKVKSFKAEKSIFIGDLPKGLYLVQMRNELGIMYTQKIILQ